MIDNDFAYFRLIFPGQYDNFIQVFNDIATGTPVPLRHDRFSAKVYVAEVPIFASNVATFFVQEYVGGNPKNIVRQKTYAFQINTTAQEIILNLYSFVDPTKFVNAQDNPGLFLNLMWSDLEYLPGCDISLDRIEPTLFRTASVGKCIVVRNNVPYEVVDTNYISPNYFTVNETWTFVSNGSLYAKGGPYNLTKLDIWKTTSHLNQTSTTRGSRRQLSHFSEIIEALSNALPVTLYIDLPNCQLGDSPGKPVGRFLVQDDFPTEGFSVDINAFEVFDSTDFASYPFVAFSDAPFVRTSQGDVIKLRKGRLSSEADLILTVTWLDPADYSEAQELVFGCRLKAATRGNSGQVLAVTPSISLTRINSFSELVSAVKEAYYFRFYARYRMCAPLPQFTAFAGGIIEGLNIGADGRSVTFSKSKLIWNYRGSGHVTNILTVTFYETDFNAIFVTSNNYMGTFKRNYTDTFVCPVSTNTSQGGVDLYKY